MTTAPAHLSRGSERDEKAACRFFRHSEPLYSSLYRGSTFAYRFFGGAVISLLYSI